MCVCVCVCPPSRHGAAHTLRSVEGWVAVPAEAPMWVCRGPQGAQVQSGVACADQRRLGGAVQPRQPLRGDTGVGGQSKEAVCCRGRQPVHPLRQDLQRGEVHLLSVRGAAGRQPGPAAAHLR